MPAAQAVPLKVMGWARVWSVSSNGAGPVSVSLMRSSLHPAPAGRRSVETPMAAPLVET